MRIYKRKFTLLFVIVVYGVIIGCKISQKHENEKTAYKHINHKMILVTVTDLSNLDGCSYALRKQDSTLLIPLDIADSLAKINLKLWVQVTEVKSMSTCMAGKLVKINYAEYVP